MKKIFNVKLVVIALVFSVISLLFTVGLFPSTSVDGWTIEDEPVYVSQIKGLTPSDYVLNRPTDIAVDDNDNIYVSDTYNHRIQKYNSSGVFIKTIGSFGTGNGQFDYPRIAVDSTHLYVLEGYEGRIQKLTLDGVFVTSWNRNGISAGEFEFPGYITVSNGFVYVTAPDLDNVQKFDKNGTFILDWGTTGTADGQFSEPMGIDADALGNIFVLDEANRTVQKFDSDGNFILKWGSYGAGAGQFVVGKGLTVDKVNSYVYTADKGYYRVQKFDLDGNFVSKWGTTGSGDGGFFFVFDVAVNSNGDVYTIEDYAGRIQKFDSNGTYLSQFGTSSTGPSNFHTPSTVFVDSDKKVYTATDALSYFLNDAIKIFEEDGTFVTSWGDYGTGDGEFGAFIYAIEEDVNGNILIADHSNDRVQIMTKDGVFIDSFGSNGTGDGQFKGIKDLDFDSSNNLYVLDYQNHRVQVFDTDYNYVSQWGTGGTGDGQLQYPSQMAIDNVNGWVYIADFFNNRVQKFDMDGNYILQWDPGYTYNQAVSLDSDGYVYTFNSITGKIIKFDSDGVELSQFGVKGPNDGQLQRNQNIYWSKTELSFYTADSFNNRIQKFSYDRTPPEFIITLEQDGHIHVNNGIISEKVIDQFSNISSVEYKVIDTWNSCTPTDSSWNEKEEEFECDFNGDFTDGIYDISLRTTDIVTNTREVLAESIIVDTVADSLRITDVGTLKNTYDSINLTYYYTQTGLTVKGIAEPYATVSFTIDGVTYTTTADSIGVYSMEFTDELEFGTNPLTYSYTDLAGNTSEDRLLTLVLGVNNFPDWLTDEGTEEVIVNEDEDAEEFNEEELIVEVSNLEDPIQLEEVVEEIGNLNSIAVGNDIEGDSIINWGLVGGIGIFGVLTFFFILFKRRKEDEEEK